MEKAKKAPKDIEKEVVYLTDAQAAELDYGKGDDDEA